MVRCYSVLLATHVALLATAACVHAGIAAGNSSTGGDTWAVIVSSSRYWLNYRHTANALGVYQSVRRQGLPDSRILLMLADQPACSPRNIHPGQLFLAPGGPATSGSRVDLNLQADDAEVDYRGREVTVDALLRLLTGRHPAGTPAAKRLRSGPTSRVLLYLTGHGGDEFLKFHDQEELLAADIAGAVAQMAAGGRYGELLLVADTCQASTLYSRIRGVPNLLAVASSKLGQSSYAHHIDAAIGQHVVDQFTFHLHQFLTTRLPPAQATHGDPPLAAQPPSLQQLLDFIAAQRLSSEVQVRTDLYPHCLADIPVTHFFGGAGEPPAAAGSSGNSSSSGSAAAQDLLALAQGQGQQTPLAYCYSAPAGQPAAGGDAPDGKLYFDLLAAAGGSGSGGGVRESQQVVPVVVAWAAAAALAHRLLRPSVS